MTKKLFSLCLSLLLLLSLFSGCGAETPGETSSPTEETQSSNSVTSKVVNGSYATCGNYNYTICMDKSGGVLNFYLICEKALPSDAYITVDIASEYKVNILNITPTTVSGNAQILDAAIRGADINWKDYYETLVAYDDAIAAYTHGEIDAEERDQRISRHREYVEKYIKPLIDDPNYRGDTPVEFYRYEIQVIITEKLSQPELIQEVQLVAGDMSRTIPVGNVRLEPEEAKESTQGVRTLTSSQWSATGITTSDFSEDNGMMTPWDDKELTCSFGFEATETITLTDVSVDESCSDYASITKVEMVVHDQRGNTKMEWTPGTPFTVRKGECAVIYVYYYNPYLKQAEFSDCVKMQLHYECMQTEYVYEAEASHTRKWNPYHIYLWAFKGFDMKSYYYDYYLPYNLGSQS